MEFPDNSRRTGWSRTGQESCGGLVVSVVGLFDWSRWSRICLAGVITHEPIDAHRWYSSPNRLDALHQALLQVLTIEVMTMLVNHTHLLAVLVRYHLWKSDSHKKV